MKRSLTLLDLVLMNLVAVTSLRWIASAASSGPSSLTLWVLAALFFFVPEGLAVAELSSRYPGEGGLYRWTQRAMGDGHGFLCGWCYWVNNLIYFPGLLLYVSANVAFAVKWLRPDLDLEASKGFVVGITLGVLWLVAVLSLIGMQAGKWLQNFGGLGNWIPALAVTILGLIAYSLRGSANPITWQSLVPNLSNLGQLSFFAQMCFALAGLELISFLGGEIKDPRRNITRGIFISATLIVSIYILGTLGILVSVPQEKITLVNGILLPIQEVGTSLGMPWLAAVCAGLITLAGVGCTFAWFAGASRVPYVVGVDRYLPASFSRLHPKYQTPHVAILVQTALATAITLFATAGASTKLESAYKILVDMCLILYFIPYCYLFLSLLKLWTTQRDPEAYHVPGGRAGNLAISMAGFGATTIAIITTLFPAGDPFDWNAPIKTFLGTAVMVGAGIALYFRGKQLRTSLSPATS